MPNKCTALNQISIEALCIFYSLVSKGGMGGAACMCQHVAVAATATALHAPSAPAAQKLSPITKALTYRLNCFLHASDNISESAVMHSLHLQATGRGWQQCWDHALGKTTCPAASSLNSKQLWAMQCSYWFEHFFPDNLSGGLCGAAMQQ